MGVVQGFVGAGEQGGGGEPGGAAAPRAAGLAAAPVGDVFAALARLLPAGDGPGLIDQLRQLESLKSAAAAKQAELAVLFDAWQRREQAAAGVPAKEQGAGVAAQVALARCESPAKGARLLGLAKALAGMPCAAAALRAGQLNEWRATLVVKETICLSAEDRAAVDAELGPDYGNLAGAGDRAVIAAAKAAAYRRDPRQVTARAARAVSERTVTIRPAPDTMTYVTALLPVAHGVAVHAALTRHADTLRSSGDPRSRGQVMADELVERVTGTPGGITGVDLQLVMTDRTLFQGDTEPARLQGYGIVPAEWARTIVLNANPHARREAPDHAGESRAPGGGGMLKVWLRRLYTAPGTGELVGMDSKARLFPPGLRRFLQTRDDLCRTPYCDAPIRHYDHVTAHHAGGSTSAANGQGLCEACNHTKEAPGWKARTSPGPRHTVRTTTPTGHTYRSTAPPIPGTHPASTDVRGRRLRAFHPARLPADTG